MITSQYPTFETVVDAISWLQQQGFNHDFGRDMPHTDRLIAGGNDFTLDYLFRFEGQTDPADEHIIYALRSDRHCIKGIIVSAFGVYADTDTTNMVNRILQ